MAFTRLLDFFVLNISFTLRLEYLLSSLEALAELHELREALGAGVQPFCYEFFLPPLREL